MLDNINNCIDKKVVVSIYTNREDQDVFSAGFVQAANEEMFLVNHITPYGLYDGYIVKQTSKVYRLDQNGQYEEKIAKLYLLRREKHIKIDIQDNDIVLSVLEFARLSKLLVSIELLDSGYSDIQGIVKEINDVIQIVQVNDYGEENGSVFINKSDISELRCDTEDEMSLKLLRESMAK